MLEKVKLLLIMHLSWIQEHAPNWSDSEYVYHHEALAALAYFLRGIQIQVTMEVVGPIWSSPTLPVQFGVTSAAGAAWALMTRGPEA